MGQESHEYGMPFPSLSSLLRGHSTHILRGRIMLERFRKHPFPLSPTLHERQSWAAFRVHFPYKHNKLDVPTKLIPYPEKHP